MKHIKERGDNFYKDGESCWRLKSNDWKKNQYVMALSNIDRATTTGSLNDHMRHNHKLNECGVFLPEDFEKLKKRSFERYEALTSTAGDE